MKTQTTISLLAAIALALASVSAVAAKGGKQGQGAQAQPQARAQVERGQKDMDRDRQQDRDRTTQPSQDRDRTQDRTHVPDQAKLGANGVYGSELMSTEERNQYSEQLRMTDSNPQAQAKLKAEHKEKMQVRAKQQGVTIDNAPGAEKAK